MAERRRDVLTTVGIGFAAGLSGCGALGNAEPKREFRVVNATDGDLTLTASLKNAGGDTIREHRFSVPARETAHVGYEGDLDYVVVERNGERAEVTDVPPRCSGDRIATYLLQVTSGEDEYAISQWCERN